MARVWTNYDYESNEKQNSKLVFCRSERGEKFKKINV